MTGDSAPRPRLASTALDTDAFDLWLRQGLSQLHGAVLKEPLPPELLRIIEDDRARREEAPKR